jgi:hypothetical protein
MLRIVLAGCAGGKGEVTLPTALATFGSVSGNSIRGRRARMPWVNVVGVEMNQPRISRSLQSYEDMLVASTQLGKSLKMYPEK